MIINRQYQDTVLPLAPIAEYSFSAPAPASFGEVTINRTIIYQVNAYIPRGFVKSTFPDGFRGDQFKYDFKPTYQHLPVEAQQFSYFQPAGTISTTALQSLGWLQPTLDQLATTRKLIADFSMSLSRSVIPIQPPFAFFDTATSKNMVGEFLAWDPLKAGTVSNFTTSGWQPHNPTLFTLPVLPQQFSSFQPAGTLTVLSNTKTNWQTLNPEIFSSLFSVADQQYPIQDLTPPFQAPQGWNGWQLDYVFAKTFPITEQQFVGFLERKISDFLSGWNAWQLDAKFAQQFSVAEQQFLSELVGLAASPPAHGGNASYDPLFDVSFSAAQQQFFTFGRQVPASPLNTKVYGWQTSDKEAFVPLYPIGNQQFSSPVLLPISIIQLPPGGGGHRRKRHGSIVQPIWDRKPTPPPVQLPPAKKKVELPPSFLGKTLHPIKSVVASPPAFHDIGYADPIKVKANIDNAMEEQDRQDAMAAILAIFGNKR
jgi:hypothetical protein